MLENFITNLSHWILGISSGNIMWVAFYAGLFVALMTSMGAFLAIFSHQIPEKGVDFSLSFAAGVMIVAAFTSLILPAIESTGSFTPAAIGIALGLLLIATIDKYTPHEHLVKGYEGPKELRDKLKMVWLLVFAS